MRHIPYKLRDVLCSGSLLAALSVACGCGGPPPAANDPPPANVRVVAARLGSIAIEVPVVGTVVASQRSQVAAGAPGKVVEYPFRQGEFVKQGEALCRLRTVNTEIELDRAKAVLRERTAQFAELSAGYRPEEVAQAEARMLAAQAQSGFADANERRKREAMDKLGNAVTAEELEQVIFEAQRAKQAYLEFKSEFEMKAAGNRQETIDAAKAAMEAAQQEVAQLEDELDKRTVPAPFDGYLVEEHTEVGQWIELGGTVATLARLDQVEVHVRIEEIHIHEIAVGDEVDVAFDALPGESFLGMVKYVVPQTQWQQGGRSFPVVVQLANVFEGEQPRLKEGMVARIVFRGKAHDSILVHKDAIDRSSGKPLVYVVAEDGRVRAVEVTEGISSGASIEITGDIEPGQWLVTEGGERLRPFDPVVVLEPPTDQDAPAVSHDVPTVKQPASSGGL